MKVCIEVKCNNKEPIKQDMDKNINDLLVLKKICNYDYLKISIDDTISILRAIQKELPSQ